MPVELKVLGYAALLQFVQFVLMAIPVNLQLGVAYTGGNRDKQEQATGVPGRLKRALDNHFEGLILFTIAVLVVVLVAAGILGGGVDPGGQGDALRTLEVRRRCGVGQHHRCQQQADNQRNRSPPCHRDTSSSSGSPSG